MSSPEHTNPEPRPPDKFRWPPRDPSTAADPPIGATGVEVTTDFSAESAACFASVLDRSDRLEPAPPTAASFDHILRAGPAWWRDFERTWLGPTHEPFARRAADQGWLPDAPGQACPRCASTTGPHEIAPLPARDAGSRSVTLACPHCRERRLPWDRAFRLGPYDGLLRDAIHDLKFTRLRPAGSTLGRLLGARLAAALDEARIPHDTVALVPLPMSTGRRWSRGIDHTLVVTRAVRSVTGGQIVRALARRHRPSQLDVPPSERARNVAGSFRPVRPERLAGRVVIVIDDVRTTGATLREACRTLQRGMKTAKAGLTHGENKATIWTAVLGVTPRPEEARTRRDSWRVEET